MTATNLSRELARKRPAQVVRQAKPEPLIINGHTVRKNNGGVIAAVLVCAVLAFLFAGFLLSMP